MREHDNDLRGALFKNDRKERDNHPDYKGSCEIDGAEYWISAWIKEHKNGKYMSLSFKEKEQERPAPSPPKRQAPQQSTPFSDMDDDIPF